MKDYIIALEDNITVSGFRIQVDYKERILTIDYYIESVLSGELGSVWIKTIERIPKNEKWFNNMDSVLMAAENYAPSVHDLRNRKIENLL